MGYHTTVVINNDALNGIQDDPTFLKDLVRAVGGVGEGPQAKDPETQRRVGALGHSVAATVVETHHADYTTVVAVAGGTATTLLSHNGRINARTADGREALLRALADELGYMLVKKPRASERLKAAAKARLDAEG